MPAQAASPAGVHAPDEYWQARQCFEHTGIPEGTWKYWAHIGKGPANFRLGRRRVWRKSVVLAWIADQEAATGNGGGADA